MNIRFTPTSNISAWTTIFTIPGGVFPKQAVSIPAGEGATMKTIVRILTDGKVIIENALNSNSPIEFNVVYFINWN